MAGLPVTTVASLGCTTAPLPLVATARMYLHTARPHPGLAYFGTNLLAQLM